MLALSIRQPYAELILRGEKTIEYRSRPTRMVGKPFHIYASKAFTTEAQRHRASLNHGWIDPETLTRGMVVGTAVISHCTNGTPGLYEWHLTKVKRWKKPRKPKGRPQPVWFRAF